MASPALLQEIIPNGLTYSIDEPRTRSERGIPLEVRYTSPLDRNIRRVWSGRKNYGSDIHNRSGVWRYREAINFLGIDTENPDVYGKHLVSFDGGENSAIGPVHLYYAAKYAGLDNNKTWFLLLGNNPSGSFKDGGMVTLFTQGKRLGVKQFICASTGNTAASLAALAANERATDNPYLERPIVVVPSGRIAEEKLLQTIGQDAQVIQVNGDFSIALDRVRKRAEDDRILYIANSINPFRIEGQKSEMFVAMEAIKNGSIDWVVTPGGNFGSTAAIHKAFREMKEWGLIGRLPRLAIVQASAANTVERLYKRGLRWNNGSVDRRLIDEVYAEIVSEREDAERKQHGPLTHMSAIDIPSPADENLLKALRAFHEMEAVVISVTDEEAWQAKYEIDRNGLGMVDLASASTVAGMKKLVSHGYIEPHQVVLGRITGRDKDPTESFRYYSRVNPPIEASDELDF